MNSFIGWIGGKKLLRKAIIERFPKDFDRYIEVCGGAGWVLFAKDKHAPLEIYNDKNNDLTNLFKCVKHHAPEMQRLLALELNSREIFREYIHQTNNNPFLTDIQRAVQFLILIKTSYGCDTKTFGCTKKNLNNVTTYLTQVQERLKDVIIENNDFEKLIKIYDRPTALFYADPPYYKTEKYYDADFKQADHLRLKQTLSTIQGKFILSYNDCDFIRDLYQDYTIEAISRNNSLTNTDRQYAELIIRNY